jgi:tape measure domain-containing protein
MSGQTLRSLVVSVSAETSAYQREMARASRMGRDYLRTIGDGNRSAAAGWRAQQAAIEAQTRSLSGLTAGVSEYARTMLGALALGSAITEADNWGQVASRLKMATGSSEEYKAVSEKLMEISDRTYKKYSDQAELFITSAKKMKELGYSTEVTTAFVDVLASGLTVSAASAEDTAEVIKAASEAIALGKLQGDQWQAMLTKAPAVIEAMADSLEVNTSALGVMASKGELVTSKWLPALIAKQQELADKTEKMPTTVGDALTRLSSHYGKWLGEQNEAAGVTQNLASLINLLSSNMDTLAISVVALGAGGLTKFAAEGAKALLTEVNAMRASIAANIGRAAAQADVMALTVRATQAEVISAQTQVTTTVGTNAHAAALARLRLARIADFEATQAQTAAQAALARASGLGARAMGGLMGLLGGPAGLAVLAAGTAASFLLFSDNAEAANTAATDLKKPIKELREEWEALGAAQQRPVLAKLVEQQAAAQAKAAEIVKEMQAVAQGPSGDYLGGQNFKANQYQRARAAGNFRRNIAAGVDIDQSTQELVAAIGPTAKLRGEIERWAASYAEAIHNSHAAGEQINVLQGILDRGAGAANNLATGLGNIKSLSPDMASTWEKKIGALTEQAAKLKDATTLGEVNRGIANDSLEDTPEGRKLAERARAAAAAADAEESAKKAREEGERKSKQAAEESLRKAKQLDDSYKRTLATLTQQSAIYGKTTELAKVKYETTQGELKSLTDAQKKELERAATAKDLLEAQKAYKDLMEGAQTAEEKLLTQMRERVKLLNEARAAGAVTPEQYDAATDQFSKAAITKAPKFGGLDASVGGAAGELIKVAEAQKEQEKWQADELERQKTFLDEKLINEQQHADRVAEITKTNNDRLSSLGTAYQVATLGMFADVTSNAGDMLTQLGQEGSTAYKALFLASKAAAIAQAIVSTEVAAAKALELGPIMGIPAASLIRGMGYASVGMIAATALTGMAHDGIDNIPREGTWLLDQGERVVDKRTNGDLKNFLSAASNDGAGASAAAPVSVTIYVQNDGSATSEAPAGLEQFGAELGRFVEAQYKALVSRDLQDGGTIKRAIRQK